MQGLSKLAFGTAAAVLLLLAAGMVVYAVAGIWRAPGDEKALLDAIGFVIIAIAVFDVARYMIEEEVIRGREMRKAGEARQSLTRFMSTIIIAVLLEAVVSVFRVSRERVQELPYPVALLFAGVALVLALAVYQRLSAAVEKELGEQVEPEGESEVPPPEARRPRKA